MVPTWPEPLLPLDPVEPVELLPEEPEEPVEPVEPVEPEEPVDPDEPVDELLELLDVLPLEPELLDPELLELPVELEPLLELALDAVLLVVAAGFDEPQPARRAAAARRGTGIPAGEGRCMGSFWMTCRGA